MDKFTELMMQMQDTETKWEKRMQEQQQDMDSKQRSWRMCTMWL